MTTSQGNEMTEQTDQQQAAAVVEGLVALVRGTAAADPGASPPELLGLTVGRAYGAAVAERDQARQVAEHLADLLGATAQHLAATLRLVPEVQTFAHDADDATAARAWLDALIESHGVRLDGSPEQESSQ